MSDDNAEKTTRRRTREGQDANGHETAVLEPEAASSTAPTETPASAKGDAATGNSQLVVATGKLQKAGSTEITGTYHPLPLPNNRPIAPSKLHFVQTGALPQNRPILVGNFQYVMSDSLPNNRPLAVNTHHYVEGTTLPGQRPVLASTLEYDANHLLPGGRPIAANDDPEIETTIGYLD